MAAATHWIVTGNFTEDGAVAWRRADGTWSRRIADAGLVDEPTAKAQSTASGATEQRLICDPYGIEVAVAAGVIDPLTARQRIRANGPTIQIRRPD